MCVDTMKIVYYNAYAPFSFEENGIMKGILVDVLDEALNKRMKLIILHEGYPWARAQEKVKSGNADAFVTIPTPERLTYTNASKQAVISAPVYLFTRAGSPKLNDLKKVESIPDLHEFLIGVYIGHGWAKQKLEPAGINLSWAPNIENLFTMVVNDRIDATIDIEPVMLYMIKKLGYSGKIIAVPVKLDHSSWHLCIAKTSSFIDILPKFDKVITDMHYDGSLDAIYKKYR